MTIKASLSPACIAVAVAASVALSGCATFTGERRDGTPAPKPSANGAHAGNGLSIDTPVATIAANPHGKAVLEHDLPGLLERPEYAMFKSMSLKSLAGLSNGKITKAKLDQVQRDLQGASVKH